MTSPLLRTLAAALLGGLLAAPAAADPVIHAFRADRTELRAGEAVQLTAVFSGGVGRLLPGGEVLSSGVPTTRVPAEDTTYLLVVSSREGTAASSLGVAVKRPGPLQTLHIVGPNGSAAWFHLMWPHVEVALADEFVEFSAQAGDFATLEPAADGTLLPADADGNRAWFATSRAPWMLGDSPMEGMALSAFMSGRDETHTAFPESAVEIHQRGDLLAAIAAIQATESAAVVPVVGVGTSLYGDAPGAPPLISVDDADQLVTLYLRTAGVDLTPTAEQEQDFGIQGLLDGPPAELSAQQRAGLYEFGRRLIVASGALRRGLSESVIVNVSDGPDADQDFTDPHKAFNTSSDLQRTKNVLEVLQAILDGFQRTLAAAEHPTAVGSRADHLLVTVHGDTPHTPLQASGWPDAMPEDSNWMYVVGKGYLKQGWFGGVHADGSVWGFDPATGKEDVHIHSVQSTAGAGAAILYAVARGDAQLAGSILGTPLEDYAALIVEPEPPEPLD